MKLFRHISTVAILAILLLFLGNNSCKDDFLDIPPNGAVGSDQLVSHEGLEGSLIATYSSLLGRRGFFSDPSNWIWGSILGGDANKGSVADDVDVINSIQSYLVLPNNAAVLEKYQVIYEGVSRANATLQLVDKAKEAMVDISNLDRIRAEARFLRGHYYFELKKIFNNTPFVDENWDGFSPAPNDRDLWPFIEADFQFAYEYLPETLEQIGRVNKWAAASYLAKTYVFQKKYAEAKVLFDLILSQGKTTAGDKYALLDYYPDAFRSLYDNNSESVFAVQAAVGTGDWINANFGLVLNFPHSSPGSPPAPGGCCGFFQPSFDLANSFRTSSSGLPFLDQSYNDSENALKSDMGVNSADSFVPDQGFLDPRIDHSIGRRGIPYLDWGLHPGQPWIRSQAYGGPYSPKKFVYYSSGAGIEYESGAWAGFTAVNYNIIRFADVLLLAAETEIELNNLEKGREYINRVRLRAKNSFLPEANANYFIELYPPFASQEEAVNAMRFERKLELSGEGHRFFDLVRWGIAPEVLNDYLSHESQYINQPFAGAKFTSGKNEYLPIPQTEIDLQGSDVLRQNSGY